MTMSTTAQNQETVAPTTDREMLDDVRRRLVRIHASMNDTTQHDPSIFAWTQQRLLELIRDVRAYERARSG
jgi:hypothetical protein